MALFALNQDSWLNRAVEARYENRVAKLGSELAAFVEIKKKVFEMQWEYLMSSRFDEILELNVSILAYESHQTFRQRFNLEPRTQIDQFSKKAIKKTLKGHSKEQQWRMLYVVLIEYWYVSLQNQEDSKLLDWIVEELQNTEYAVQLEKLTSMPLPPPIDLLGVNEDNTPTVTSQEKQGDAALFNSPILKDSAIAEVVKIFEGLFSKDDIIGFEDWLRTGISSTATLIFNDAGNRLLDALKKLHDYHFIVGLTKKRLAEMIAETFQYRSKFGLKDFKTNYARQGLTDEEKFCKNPILEVKNGIIQASNLSK